MDLLSIVTPIKHDKLRKMLVNCNYPEDKTNFLINSFSQGFDLHYTGEQLRQDFSDNIPLKIGNKTILWNKLMKEIRLGRVAGPFKEVPYDNFMQSPIGLVPKDDNKTRLIFHLSYEFKSGKGSLNSNTPEEKCHVKYHDLDEVVDRCIRMIKKLSLTNKRDISDKPVIFYSKTDLTLAFRILPLKITQFKWVVMMAHHPVSGKKFYFIDKCLPFGASISCALFQEFSDALCAIFEFSIGSLDITTNYLDDFLFIAATLMQANERAVKFIAICEHISCPVSEEKTVWGSSLMIFLGTLPDGVNHCLCIPVEKRNKALNRIKWVLSKKKATIKEIQSLTGLLNFLNHAIVPGRAFTRRMYAKIKTTDNRGKSLKQHHHITIDQEFKLDAYMWQSFLENCTKRELCRPFLDQNVFETSQLLNFSTDASGKIGFGCVFRDAWTFGKWSAQFLVEKKPSIEYLELYALCIAIYTWEEDLRDKRIIVFCDNQSVVDMVNKTSSSCKNCMILIRLLVLNNIKFNRRVFVRHVRTEANILADSLSRANFKRFWKNAPKSMNRFHDKLPEQLWLVEKLDGQLNKIVNCNLYSSRYSCRVS